MWRETLVCKFDWWAAKKWGKKKNDGYCFVLGLLSDFEKTNSSFNEIIYVQNRYDTSPKNHLAFQLLYVNCECPLNAGWFDSSSSQFLMLKHEKVGLG